MSPASEQPKPTANTDLTHLELLRAKERYITYLNRFVSTNKLKEIYDLILEHYSDPEHTQHIIIDNTSIHADTFKNTIEHLIRKGLVDEHTLAPIPGKKLARAVHNRKTIER